MSPVTAAGSTALGQDLRQALQQGIASHRAGRRAEAEAAYRAVLAARADHAEANHHLGVLLVQSGRIEDGLAHLKAALQANPQPVYWASYARGLAAALAADPRNAVLLDELGSALLVQGRVGEAIAHYREALVAAPDFADAHYHLGSVLSENDAVAEGFAHYMRRAALVYGSGKAPRSEQPDPPHKVNHDLAQRDYLGARKDLFQLADGTRLEGPAVNAAAATPGLVEAWRRNSPQRVVVDDFLTMAALVKLRAYCAGSTVWKKIYAAGYLGAAPEDGFAAPLLAQIVEEIQGTYRAILDGAKFRYLGAFKYDSENCAGTNTHGDNALVNVNLYIAPDEANLDPEHGGMEIWDRAATDMEELRRYNGNETALRAMLENSGARASVIPHRANRAVIFKSTLFHKTDTFRFRSDYLSRRINVSLLFGQFG
jgi:tetratricopeptide (TPR) repeat protein